MGLLGGERNSGKKNSRKMAVRQTQNKLNVQNGRGKSHMAEH